MEIKKLRKIVSKLRLEAARMVYEGKDGHLGPALSTADIVTTLYSDVIRVDPRDPHWPDRGRFILFKDHACSIWCTVFNERGCFQLKVEHFRLRGLHNTLQEHLSMRSTPGVDMIPGSLGNEITIGAGMALAVKIMNRPYYTYVICGDDELQEGVCWEDVNVAIGQGLDNLIIFVDRNGWQNYKKIEQTTGIDNLADRFCAFGWYVQEICGHDIEATQAAIAVAKGMKGCPSCIACDCVKGRDIGYVENNST